MVTIYIRATDGREYKIDDMVRAKTTENNYLYMEKYMNGCKVVSAYNLDYVEYYAITENMPWAINFPEDIFTKKGDRNGR
jgi:hypothetical protein